MGARILYLDDEEPLVFLMKRMLQHLGHQVAAFSRCEDALVAFEGAPGDFDLVLTDMSMPGISGIEFAQKILAIRADALVVIATGHIQDKDLEKVRKRIAEIESFLPTLRGDDLEAFKRIKYKLRRTVMRLTYDLHHLFKRLEKYRKNIFMAGGGFPRPEHERVPLEAVAEIPEPPPIDEHDEP